MRGKYLNIFGECAERIYASMEKTQILTNYTIWDGLSQKNISRCCPFKFSHTPHLFLKSGESELQCSRELHFSVSYVFIRIMALNT
jgi:hypothetical protein